MSAKPFSPGFPLKVSYVYKLTGRFTFIPEIPVAKVSKDPLLLDFARPGSDSCPIVSTVASRGLQEVRRHDSTLTK